MRTINSIFKTFFVALLLAVQVHFAYAQTAALLPVAPQQFFDKNGNPVSSGSVGYYIPGTSTPKMVWQDDSQTTPWTNPITLNAGGWPPNNKGIYGNGTYRQIIKDKYNNIISDQPTSATGSGGGSGTSVGDGNSVGTILTWSGMIAPNQYQFAYGQSLSRATYPELYQAITLATDVVCVGGNATLTSITDTSNIPVGAALEGNCIVAGSTVISKTINTVTLSIAANISTTTNVRFFPYGNGNGTTTFNAPDLRGKVIPGRTNMGGVTASNLTNTYYGSSPDAVGANGGTQSSTLAQSNLPNVNFNVSIPSGQGSHNHSYTIANISSAALQPGGASIPYPISASANTGSTTLPALTGTAASGGSGTAFSLVQPSITLNYIIKVTPDTSISGLFGVASIGGMQGIINCGTGVTCAGNIISVTPSSGVPVAANSIYGNNTGSPVTSGLSLTPTQANNLLSTAPWNDNTAVSGSGSAAKFFNPTYFGNPATGIVSKFNRLQVGVSTSGGTQIPQSPLTWPETYISAWSSVSQVDSISAIGNLGVTGASRTSDYRAWAGSASGGSQGISGFALNDDTTPATTPIACGVCGNVIHLPSVDGISLNQFDAGNTGTSVISDPYTGVSSGSSWATGLTSGAYPPYNTSNVSGALYIGAGTLTSGKFNKGIVVFNDALSTASGAGGNGVAVEMARGQSLRWINSSHGVDAELFGGNGGFYTGQRLISGLAGSATGQLGLSGITSGTLIQTVASIAGTPIVTWGNNTGTPAVTASAPLSINTTTGDITCTNCVNGTFTSNAIMKGNGAGSLTSSGCSISATNAINCSSSSAFQPPMTLTNSAADTNGTNIVVAKSNGGAAVTSGTALGGFAAQAFTTALTTVGTVQFNTTGSVSGSNVPTALKISTSNSAGVLNQVLSFDQNAHLAVITQSTATTVTSCGTSPSIAGAKDTHGTVTVGTSSPTSCTINFGNSYASPPDCTVQSNPQVAAFSWVTGTSSIVITQTATSSNKIIYHCLGQ